MNDSGYSCSGIDTNVKMRKYIHQCRPLQIDLIKEMIYLLIPSLYGYTLSGRIGKRLPSVPNVSGSHPVYYNSWFVARICMCKWCSEGTAL